jgi:hypothetical protein
MAQRTIGDGRYDIEPRGDYPPEWDRDEEPGEYEPEPPDPDDAFMPEDWP